MSDHDDLSDAAFSADVVDYAALRAAQLYSADCAARDAYARGFADGLSAGEGA